MSDYRLAPVRVIGPAAPLVLLARAKTHLRVDHDDDDALISSLVAAAEAHLDGWTGILGRCVQAQSWRQDYGCFTPCLRIPLGPVTAVTHVKYYDANEVLQTVTSTNYRLLKDALGHFIEPVWNFTWPSSFTRPDAVQVTYSAGYEEGSQQLDVIRAAGLLLLSHWYENREAVNVGNIVTEMPLGVDRLLAPLMRGYQ